MIMKESLRRIKREGEKIIKGKKEGEKRNKDHKLTVEVYSTREEEDDYSIAVNFGLFQPQI